MTDPLLRVENIHTYYGKSHILHGVSLEVGHGEVVGLLGRNGVGKSTTLKAIAGLIRPSQGRILFDGKPVGGLAAHRLARLGIGYVPEERRIFPLLTVGENLRTGLDRHGVGKADELAANLSHGEQRNLEIGIALATEPQLLCLDEPTAGMSAAETHETMRLVRKIAKDLTILVVEHDMQVVMELCNRITVLHYGAILADGTPDEIQQNARVQEVYLKT